MDIDPNGFGDQRWRSRAELIRVKDGDTYVMRRELPEYDRRESEPGYRLWGLDTWEINKPEQRERGLAAKAFAEQWFLEHLHGLPRWQFWIDTDHDKETLGRFIAKVWCSQGHSLEDALRAGGHEKVLP